MITSYQRWYRAHKAERKLSNQKYWAANVEKQKEKKQLWRYSQYGLSAEQYQALLEKQNYCCAICGKDQSIVRGKRFSVDHDHKCCPSDGSCGKCVRGLLCMPCNIMIGMSKDTPNVLKRGAEYLAQYKPQ